MKNLNMMLNMSFGRLNILRCSFFLLFLTAILLILWSVTVSDWSIGICTRRDIIDETKEQYLKKNVHVNQKPCLQPADFRQRIARELYGIIRDMKRAEVCAKPIHSSFHYKLINLAAQLDPRVEESQEDKPIEVKGTKNISQGNHRQNVSKAGNTVAPQLDVCPEVYKGPKVSYPFQQNAFQIENCTNVKPLASVVTLVINTISYKEDHLKRMSYVLKGITSMYGNLSVLISTDSEYVKSLAQKFHKIEITDNKNSNYGEIWNSLLKKVKTPFVWIGRDLAHFNEYARLERQIRVISQVPYVGVAGGTIRNMTGHWRDGCYQSSIRNYHLQYRAGYEYSTEECMFCDYLEGSFVARTDIFVKQPLDEKLPAEIVFRDWFLKLKVSDGGLVLNCPDVMYFNWGGEEEQYRNKSIWLNLAKQWGVEKVSLPPKYGYQFTCAEVNIKCKMGTLTKYHLIPPCCTAQFSQAMYVLEDFCNQHGLQYEIEGGSGLGVEKIHDFMPWDIDADITFLTKDYYTFKNNISFFKSKGLNLASFEPPKKTYPGYFAIYTPDIKAEMWGYKSLSSQFLPEDIRHIPTQLNVRGVWLRGQSNPGLYGRNRFGPKCLKHSQSWIYRGLKNSWGKYDAGKWNKCPDPTYHGCLDIYPPDGSIEYIPVNFYP